MTTEPELLEVFRLGELARDQEIVRTVGDRMAGFWSHGHAFVTPNNSPDDPSPYKPAQQRSTGPLEPYST